jgi:enoyl-CoA hydratase/carnithine racemase
MSIENKQYESFKTEQNGGVAIITLNRPEMANSFLLGFFEEFFTALSEINEDVDVKVVVLRAEGKIFSAGANLDFLKHLDTSYKAHKSLKSLNRIIKLMYNMPKPIISVIDGAAAGGGANLALSCDFIIASEKAKFLFPFINLGLMPDTGGLWTLTQRVGAVKAKEIAMRGMTIGAEEALEIGLITKLTSSDNLDKEAMSLAKELADKPVLAISAIKQISNRISEMTIESYCQIEESIMSMLLVSKDSKEGVNAFIEKRKPNFKGE